MDSATPPSRRRVGAEMEADHPDWENLYFDGGGASGVVVASVMNPELKEFESKNGSGNRPIHYP